MTEKTGGHPWTEDQTKTIEQRNKNILVSAAAGSGKTAVLVERIKRLIIDDNKEISGFLITTFTKAAAEEMRNRLEKAIRSEMEKSEGEKRRFLARQLYQLPGASISTFHSFAIDIIRQYFYLVDIEPGFKIGDTTQMSIMEKEALDELLEQEFSQDDPRFRQFLKRHSGDRNENKIKENILSTYHAWMSIPGYFDWAQKQVEKMNTDSDIPPYEVMKVVLEESADYLEKSADLYEEAVSVYDRPDTPEMHEKTQANALLIRSWAEKIRQDLSEGRNYEEVYQQVSDILDTWPIPKLSQPKDKNEKIAYKEVKDEAQTYTRKSKEKVKSLKSRYFLRSLKEYNEEIRASYPDTKYFMGLVRKFELIFKEKKKEAGCIDFNDVMHLAIEILGNKKAAQELREKYEFIFIDEYQDSNDLQEKIVGRFKREDNLFMVGDVKQSIYKFRLAEPELFLRRDAAYRPGTDEHSIVIDLNKNFRSKRSVTDAVNAVFRKAMNGYDENAELHCTIEEDEGHPTILHVIDHARAQDADGFDLETAEMEAALAAKRIRETLGKEFYDSSKEVTRKIRYQDIAILVRGNAPITDLERYLNNEGIPAYGDYGAGYFETVELQVFLNILKVISNMRQDIPLISAMRSVLFGFTTKELAEIRAFSPKGSYSSAVISYTKKGPTPQLKEKLNCMVSQLEKWKGISRSLPLDELLRMLLYDTGFMDYCSGLPSGSRRVANLRILIEKAAAFEMGNKGGLYGFLNYVNSMKLNKISDSEAKSMSQNEDVVRIMTIHKSKGLEFPIVFLLGAGKDLARGGKGGSQMPLHKNLGFGLDLVNREKHWHTKTLLQKAIADQQSMESVEEEIRILYVAMTRAMDRLEIIGSVKDAGKLKERVSKGSYVELVYGPLKSLENAEVEICQPTRGMSGSHREPLRKSAEILMQGADSGDFAENAEIKRRMDFSYPKQSGQPIKMKYSVSELNQKYELPIHVSELIREESGQKLTPAQIGTAMHFMMERMDFGKACLEGEAYIREFADGQAASGMLSERERESLDIRGLEAFFQTDIGRRAAAAAGRGDLHRENEFILEETIEGSDVIVQGIIDCWFEEDGELILIDYKNSQMYPGKTENMIKEQYAEQMKLYRKALEESQKRKVKEAYLYLFRLGKAVFMP